MRENKYYCDWCQVEIDEWCVINDDQFCEKDFCSQRCIYEYYQKKVKESFEEIRGFIANHQSLKKSYDSEQLKDVYEICNEWLS